ncbi:hypothetical protein EVAR_17408_1 [Eumeta japonica]|uniref:Uncharacterized protein n=1 Tax=Eumeta variegata TaxID=151549 RepID=A0A4C1VBA2_EUMVA|nr:hypothetical protein EVAR_17408_1 [Eumeta japonica]
MSLLGINLTILPLDKINRTSANLNSNAIIRRLSLIARRTRRRADRHAQDCGPQMRVKDAHSRFVILQTRTSPRASPSARGFRAARPAHGAAGARRGERTARPAHGAAGARRGRRTARPAHGAAGARRGERFTQPHKVFKRLLGALRKNTDLGSGRRSGRRGPSSRSASVSTGPMCPALWAWRECPATARGRRLRVRRCEKNQTETRGVRSMRIVSRLAPRWDHQDL